MNKVDTINCARNYLLTHGWTQGTFQNGDGNVCLMGAFNRQIPVIKEELLDEIMSDIRSLVRGGIMTWNDNPDRTFSEVMDLLDELALKAKDELSE